MGSWWDDFLGKLTSPIKTGVDTAQQSASESARLEVWKVSALILVGAALVLLAAGRSGKRKR